jgi:hypothetical protein
MIVLNKAGYSCFLKRLFTQGFRKKASWIPDNSVNYQQDIRNGERFKPEFHIKLRPVGYKSNSGGINKNCGQVLMFNC